MGIETKALLKGKVEHDEVLDFVKKRYDANAISHVEFTNYGSDSGYDWIKERYDNTGEWLSWSGFISFYDGEKRRSLFYCYVNHNSYRDVDQYARVGLVDMVKSETTYLRIYNCPKEIMKEIVTHFGGWIDESGNELYCFMDKNMSDR